MRSRTRARTTPAARRDRLARPRLEGFEDRLLLATIVAKDVTELRAAIDTANVATTPTTIELVAGTRYLLLDAPYAYNDGLPPINPKQALTILGSGARISSFGKKIRMLDIVGGQVVLKNLTLFDADAISTASSNLPGLSAGGGLRVTGGTVVADDVTVMAVSTASGQPSQQIRGGGIFVGGTAVVTLNDSLVTGNTLFHTEVFGVGVYVDSQATLRLNRTNVTKNTAASDTSGDSMARGGGIYNAGTTEIVGGSVSSNRSLPYLLDGVIKQSGAQGGGIYNSGTLMIAGTVLSTNQVADTASVAGGGIYVAGGTVSISGSTLSGNQASGQSQGTGGGIYVAGGTAYISGSTLSGNQATGSSQGAGGGIYSSGGTLNLSSSTLSGNMAIGVDGAAGADQPTASRDNNGAPGGKGQSGGRGLGGGIYVADAAARVGVVESSVIGNSATGGDGGRGGNGGKGAAGYVDQDTAVPVQPRQGGRGGDGGVGGDGEGGGIYLSNGGLTLLRSLVANNPATAGGGGAGGNGGAGGDRIPRSVTGDRPGVGGAGGAGGDAGQAAGGGIFKVDGTLSVLNTTVAGNSAVAVGAGAGGSGGSGRSNGAGGVAGARGSANGGGIYSTYSGAATDLTLTAATVANNFLFGDYFDSRLGTGLYLVNSTATIGNSLFAGNYLATPTDSWFPTLPSQDVVGTVTSRGSNLVSDGRYGLNFAASDQVGTSAGFINARLGPLQDNGGPTWTMALRAGSPAINAGNDVLNVTPEGRRLDSDQRGAGYRRSSQGTPDIGAYEVLSATGIDVADTYGGKQTATVGTLYRSNPIALVVDSGVRASNTFVTFTAPATGAGGTFSNGQTSIRVASDAHGMADPGPFLANNIAGAFTIQAVADGGPTATFRYTNAAIATQLAAVSGSAIRNGPVQVTATLLTAAGPLANQAVTFSLIDLNASITVLTDAQGVATASFGQATSNSSMTFSASYAGTAQYAAATAEVKMPVTPYGAPARILLGETNYPAVAGDTTLAGYVRVVDAYGNPVPKVVVAFSAPAAAGSFVGASTATTDDGGYARTPSFATNFVAGTYNITATVPASPAVGSISVPLRITQATSTTSGVALTAVRNGTGTLTARVTNASLGGRPVAGATVTFSLGGSVYGSAITDAAGVANLAYTGGSPQSIASVQAATTGTGGYTASSAAGTITILPHDVASAVAPVAGPGLIVPVGGTLATPIRVRVTDRFGNAVPSAGVTFSAFGAVGEFDGGTLAAGWTVVTVATDADGVAVAPAFRANSRIGSYPILAAVAGVATEARLTLTVVARATVSSTVALDRGAAGTVALATAADGLRLLPAGRSATLPWLNLRRLTITLDAAAPLAAGDVRVTGVNVADYGPVAITGSGTTYTLTLARPIAEADWVTVAIGNASVATFTRRLDVLPGDLNDDGAVTQADVIGIRNQYLGFSGAVPTASGDVNGDGVVNLDDYNEARRRVGTVLA